MSEHIPKVTIIDILDALEAVLEFSSGIIFEDFLSDRKTRDAIYRNIEVMGEATNRLPDYFLHNHPEIEWNKMISTRIVLARGYDKINDKIIWNILRNILPGLKIKLENLLSQL